MTSSSSVPEKFMEHLASSKLENNSNYKIDDIDVREFTGECWKLLSSDERKHYREQLENPEIAPSDPNIKKLAFDLNRGLQSAYNETSKNNSHIEDELSAQVTNFKYVNLSNSDLHKDQKLGLFANEPFQNRDEFKDQPLLAISMETSLSTFPSIERLGHNSEDKDKFIDTTAEILKGVTSEKNGSILNRGSLDATLTASVAAYVDKNFKDLKKLTKEDQKSIGETFKKKYQKVYNEKKSNTKKGHPVEISSGKLADTFERATAKRNLLKLDPPPLLPTTRSSSPIAFLRNMMSSTSTATTVPKAVGNKPASRGRQ